MITQNVYDYITKHKTEFFEEVRIFLDGLNLYKFDFKSSFDTHSIYSTVPEHHLYEKRNIEVSFNKANDFQSPESAIDLLSLKIQITVFEDKVYETKHPNLWGKVTVDRQFKSEMKFFYCFPFQIDWHSSGGDYINFKDLKSLSSFLNNEERVVYFEIIDFFYDIISRYNGKIKAIENSFVDELSKININEITSDTKGIDLDFKNLISKNQKAISLIDKDYLHKFIRLSNFIRTKKQNILDVHAKILESESTVDKLELINILHNQIYSYNLVVLHSLSMLTSLIDNDMFTFFEIYESFDKLNVFNSNWENEVSEKLTDIGDKLVDLMLSIYKMEQNIVIEMNNLSYITQESFKHLHQSLNDKLSEINSSINTNNLLSGIQAYQLYKINNNTKGIK